MAKAWFIRIRNYLGRRLFRLAQRVSVDAIGGPTGSFSLSVVSPQLKPDELHVSPGRPYAEDLLGREPFGDGLTRLVDYGGGTGVVLIDAGWGNGKTTFLRMWIQKARNDGKVVAALNAWDGDYRDNPLECIAENLASELQREVPRSRIHRLRNRLHQFGSFLWGPIQRYLPAGLTAATPADGGAAWTVAIAIGQLIHSLRNVKSADPGDVRRLESVRVRLRRAAATVRRSRTGQSRGRFVVVIDELDRCRPDYAVRFLEIVKHVFEVEHITFVLAANSTELAHAMRGVYGDEFDGESYLERFFDIRLHLPEGTRERFVTRVVNDASFLQQSEGDRLVDELGDLFTAEEVVAYMLRHSALSLREIHKTLKHIQVLLLFYRLPLAPYILTALVLATLRSVAREAYDSLEGGYQGGGAVDLLCTRLGKESTTGEPILELADDILYWCWQEAEQELRSSGRRRRDAPKLPAVGDDLSTAASGERRSARKHLVNYRLVRDAIEMTAPAKDSS